MGIEVRQLRYAVMTADTQSFSRAAAVLNVKQSTLSRRVLQLEDRLGVKLFERTTRGAEPTDNGRVFIEQARRIVTDIDNLQTTARNVSYGLHGRIAVGYCSPLMAGNLKLAISDYLTQFPDVQFDGVEAGPGKLFHGLKSRTIDVAVAPIGLEEASLKSRKLWSERLFAVLLADSPLADQAHIYWQELRREVYVVPNGGIGPILGNLINARLPSRNDCFMPSPALRSGDVAAPTAASPTAAMPEPTADAPDLPAEPSAYREPAYSWETSMTGGREPLSRPSSRHGEARQPLTLTLSWVRSRERLARLPRQESAP